MSEQRMIVFSPQGGWPEGWTPVLGVDSVEDITITYGYPVPYEEAILLPEAEVFV